MTGELSLALLTSVRLPVNDPMAAGLELTLRLQVRPTLSTSTSGRCYPTVPTSVQCPPR